MFAAPAARPLIIAIVTGSADDNLRVKIVINAPAYAGAGNERCPYIKREALPLPRQDYCAEDNGQGAQQQASIDVFAKGQPRNPHRCKAFKIEEQRR